MSKLLLITDEHAPEHIGDDVEVTPEPDIISAIDELRQGNFDGILIPKSYLEKGVFFDEFKCSNLVNAIGEEICVIDKDFTIIWANKAFREQHPHFESTDLNKCYEVVKCNGEHCKRCLGDITFQTGEKNQLIRQTPNERYMEDTFFPILANGSVAKNARYLVRISRDVTETVRLQQKIDSIYSAGQSLTSIDLEHFSTLSLAQQIDHIKDNIVYYAKKLLNYNYFSVQLINPQTGFLDFVITEGFKRKKIKELKLKVAESGSGISGHVAYTGKPYLCRDKTKDPLFIEADAELYSSITVPLKLMDKVIGVFNVEHKEPNAFDENDLKLLEIFASQVSVALNIAKLIQKEYALTVGTTVQKIAYDINNPLNAILNNLYLLLQEYIGHDENTTSKLKDIEFNVDRIKKTISNVADIDSPQFDISRRFSVIDSSLAGKKLLIADDDEAIRQTLTAILTKDGCIVDTASDGQETVEMIKERNYDLVICDIRMPKKDGYEVYAETMQAKPDVPVILMTAYGYDPNHLLVKARRDGLEAVLFKPFKVDMLKKEIKKALKIH